MSALRRILCIAVILPGLVFAIKSSFVTDADSDAGSSKRPAALVRLDTQIQNELEQREAADFKAIKSKVDTLLRKDPLNNNALVYYGNALQLGKDSANFDSNIYNVVKSRNPRNRKNLDALLLHSLSTGDFYGVLDVASVMFQLDDIRRAAISNLMISLYGMEEGAGIINDYLPRRPAWEYGFLNAQSRNLTKENLDKFVETANISLNLSEDPDRMVAPVTRTLYALIDAGRTDQAHALWHDTEQKIDAKNPSFLKEDLQALNYNPGLASVASPPPFNWTFRRGKNASFEPGRDGLYVSFSEERERTIAVQYFKPPQGQLSVAVKADYRYSDKQGRFSVDVRCVNPLTPPLRLSMDEAKQGEPIIRQTFDGLGADCPLASISLVANPGIFNERISATFEFIAVTSGGAAQ